MTSRAGAPALALVVVVASPIVDAAPSIDPAAARAADANLESTASRRGFTGALALGPSITIGNGTGNGGALSLRLGQVATPHTVITFEIAGGAQLRRLGAGAEAETVANSVLGLLVGAQRWIGPSLWVRIGGGVGTFTCPQKCEGAPLGDSVRLTGLAGIGGIGVEVVRVRGLTLGVELFSLTQLNRDGLLATGSLALSVGFD